MKASFFLTGNFYRNKKFRSTIRKLQSDGHYLGAHSDQHLLYCDWSKRDSLLVTRNGFTTDLYQNYAEMSRFGIEKENAQFFLPPFEWYNDTIAEWTSQQGLTLINFTPGTLSHADYTTPEMKNYRSSEEIMKSILTYERKNNLNGFILLMHIGTDSRRTDKLYDKLPDVLMELQTRGYRFVRVDELLGDSASVYQRKK